MGEDRLLLSPPPLSPSSSEKFGHLCTILRLPLMVAGTAPPIAAMSSVAKMNPTSTEHDYRFPRRPTARDSNQSIRASDNGESNMRLSLRELGSGFDGAYASASNALLGPAQLPLTRCDHDGGDAIRTKSPQNESVVSQLFKMVTQHKQQMPNQRRMENMTWRLMSLQMRQQALETRRQKYDPLTVFFPSFFHLCDEVVRTIASPITPSPSSPCHT